MLILRDLFDSSSTVHPQVSHGSDYKDKMQVLSGRRLKV